MKLIQFVRDAAQIANLWTGPVWWTLPSLKRPLTRSSPPRGGNFAHQHPSGVAEPSQGDERITRRLKSALELVDIRVLDHIVIGGDTAVSLASRGLLMRSLRRPRCYSE